MKFIIVFILIIIAGHGITAASFHKSSAWLKPQNISNLAILALPRDSADKGVFLLSEYSFSSSSDGIKQRLWHRLTRGHWDMRHYQIYYNGRSIGLFEDDHREKLADVQNNLLPLEEYLEDYEHHHVVQIYNPSDPAHSDQALASFIENYKLGHSEYTLTTKNCQKFAVDLCYNFFKIKVLSQSKLIRRVAQFAAFVGTAAVVYKYEIKSFR